MGKQLLLRNVGLFLMLLSGVFFFAMISVPWWSMSSSQKAFYGGGLFVGVQAAWWLGVLLAGPATIAKLKSWFKKDK
jgi:hypothetical protein